MSGELVPRFPWEPPATPSTDDVVKLMQRDMAYMVTHTAIMVHSSHELLRCVVNTPRGQIIPRGECKFTDGSTVELQDIGMPQINCEILSVADLMARVWEVARELGLELAI